jgi:hypothetical protein
MIQLLIVKENYLVKVWMHKKNKFKKIKNGFLHQSLIQV